MVKKVLGGALVFFLLIGCPIIAGTLECRYTREGVVTKVVGNEISVEDTTHNIWVFEGDDFEEGDRVKLYMFDGCTNSDISDDKIINAKIIK